ncbi:MAG: RNA polymerase factor sigma-54 [Anaerovoracaceae bacterium]
MKLGYELTIKQTQKLNMTPELIQAIKILQLNTIDLQNYVQKELEENPILEVKDDGSDDRREEFDYRDTIVEDDYDDLKFRQWETSPDKETIDYERFVTAEETLQDSLLRQLQLSGLDQERERIGRGIIEAIDENGYLKTGIDEMTKICGCSCKTLEDVLSVIQSMEPTGVGARNLQECLMIQLREKGCLTEDLQYIIENMLEDVAANRISKIARSIHASSAEVQDMIDEIRDLEPKPGRQYAGSEPTRYIVPDIIVEKEDGEYVIWSNDRSVPKLMVSSYYKNLRTQAKKDEDLNKYLTGRFNSAVWLIRSIEQRKQTILNVATAIVHYQIDFFEKGEKYIRPLTLKQIAEELNIHESTVSRAISGKFMQSPRGVYDLKYFFSSGVESGSGDGISSNSVKSMIRDFIENEDTRKPLSDQEMADRLKDRGVKISRRTVAKYREAMGIQPSSRRKRY